MKITAFRRRVLVIASDSDLVPFCQDRIQAERMVELGQAKTEEIRGGFVVSIKLTGTPLRALESVRPGSYGIECKRVAPGVSGHAGLVYSHHQRIYEREARAA